MCLTVFSLSALQKLLCYIDAKKGYECIITWKKNSVLSPDFGACEDILVRKCVFLIYPMWHKIPDPSTYNFSICVCIKHGITHSILPFSPRFHQWNLPRRVQYCSWRIPQEFQNHISKLLRSSHWIKRCVWTTRWEKSLYFPQSWETRELPRGHGNQVSADWDLCTSLSS